LLLYSIQLEELSFRGFGKMNKETELKEEIKQYQDKICKINKIDKDNMGNALFLIKMKQLLER